MAVGKYDNLFNIENLSFIGLKIIMGDVKLSKCWVNTFEISFFQLQ